MGSWSEKVVLVTGGSSGIGLATAVAFAGRGAHVVIAARGEDALQRAAEQLNAAGMSCSWVSADVTRAEDVSRMVADVAERRGRLDVLVNNAGRSMRKRIVDTTPGDFRALMELNFYSAVGCTLSALPMLRQSRGHVVNIASLAGRAVAPGVGAYPASKFAMVAWSQQLRLELADEGIHVMSVCPGPVDTGLHERATANDPDAARVPEGLRKPGAGLKTRTLRPEEVAEAIVTGCDRRTPDLLFPGYAPLLLAAMQLDARLSDWLILKLTGARA